MLAPSVRSPMTMRRFFDIGANLTDQQFSGIYRGKSRHACDFDAIIARSKAAGCTEMLVTGSDLPESTKAMEIAQREKLFSTCGIHPCSAKQFAPEYYESLSQLALHGKQLGVVRAFGEFGLDYDRLHYADASTQRQVFIKQLEIAQKIRLPLFLHMRAAAADFIEILQPWMEENTWAKGVVHSFTGSIEELKQLLALGLYIGVNGCSMKTEENLATIKQIPLDRIMLETDAPWCEIRPSHASSKYVTMSYEAVKPEKWVEGKLVRGRAEPCQIVGVAQVVAAVQGVSLEQVEQAAWDNSVGMFGHHGEHEGHEEQSL